MASTQAASEGMQKPKFNKYASRNERKNFWDKDDRDDAWETENAAMNERAYELVKTILEKEKQLRASKEENVPVTSPFISKRFNANGVFRLLLMSREEIKAIHNSDFLGKYSYKCCDEMELRALLHLLPRTSISSDPRHGLRAEIREVLRKMTKDHASKEVVEKVKITPFW